MKKFILSSIVMALMSTAVVAKMSPETREMVIAKATEEYEKYGDDYLLRRQKYVSTAGTLPPSSYYPLPSKVSCCGEADAYEADDIHVEGDKAYAVLTCNDERNCEEFPGKIKIAPGTKFLIPPERQLMNTNPINNTGHGWIWILSSGSVICYSPPPGY